MSLFHVLLGFLVNTAVLSGLGLAAQLNWPRWAGRTPSSWETLLVGVLVPLLAGYLAFWAYFLHPLAGRLFSWILMLAVLGTLVRLARRRDRLPPAPPRPLFLLTLAAGIFFISALLVYPETDFSLTARNRFLAGLPADNEIPRLFTEHLFAGTSPKNLIGDWLSSDRPPLQTGLALVALPALRLLHVDMDAACATAGVWFQLLWVPAGWGFLRWLGAKEREALAVTAALVFTGFVLFYSIYVWPKFGSAALGLLAFCTFFADEPGAAAEETAAARRRFVLGGALASLGCLAHGGVMFSLLALAPIALWRAHRRWREWLWAAAAFAVLALPWSAYQRFYEPPGNRLLKWHLAGVMAVDARDVTTTLRDSYQKLGWGKAAEARWHNFHMLTNGDWVNLPALGGDTNDRHNRRINESAYLFRSASLWILGLGALAWLIWNDTDGQTVWRRQGERHVVAAAWLGLTLAAWIGLMFIPNSVWIHQGSLAAPLIWVSLLAMWTLLAGRWVFLAFAALEIVYFGLNWLPPSPAVGGPPDKTAVVLCAVAACFCVGLLIQNGWRPDETDPARPPRPQVS